MSRARRSESFSVEGTRMTEPNPNVATVFWRIVIAALVVLTRLALDRFSVRGHTRQTRRAGDWRRRP